MRLAVASQVGGWSRTVGMYKSPVNFSAVPDETEAYSRQREYVMHV